VRQFVAYRGRAWARHSPAPRSGSSPSVLPLIVQYICGLLTQLPLLDAIRDARGQPTTRDQLHKQGNGSIQADLTGDGNSTVFVMKASMGRPTKPRMSKRGMEGGR
jgi:hypothetical protein